MEELFLSALHILSSEPETISAYSSIVLMAVDMTWYFLIELKLAEGLKYRTLLFVIEI